MKNFLTGGGAILGQRQSSILSAAFVVMAMLFASRVLGLIKYRVLNHYFVGEDRSVFLASFIPSDTFFEILVSGSLAAAFVPVFASLMTRGEKERAWYVAGITQTTVFIAFLIISALLFIFAGPITSLIPNVPDYHHETIIALTRFFILVQLFFTLSFILTTVQETFGRFLVPAMAPLFYNLGIILSMVFLSHLGLWGPAIGAVIGAALHLFVQLPFAKALGFRFIPKINLPNPDFRKIVVLSLPRMGELTIVRLSVIAELYLAFFISSIAFSDFIYAKALQLFPVALFGYAFAKASMPTLALQAVRGDKEGFARTFTFATGQVIFFILPIAVALAVLRIPVVRIAYGAGKFTWEETVQTGLALSAFAVGLVGLGIKEVLARCFYATHDTKTPMFITFFSTTIYILLAFYLITVHGLGIWGIAIAFSVATLLQTTILLLILDKRMQVISNTFFITIGKIGFAGGVAGIVMFFLLKVLDQAVWDKRLSILGKLGLALPIGFQQFVLDTRYTIDLIFLTIFVVTIGIFIYLSLAVLLRVKEVGVLSGLIGQILTRKVTAPSKSTEPEIPAPLPPGG